MGCLECDWYKKCSKCPYYGGMKEECNYPDARNGCYQDNLKFVEQKLNVDFSDLKKVIENVEANLNG